MMQSCLFSLLVGVLVLCSASSVVGAQGTSVCGNQSTNSYVLDAYTFCWHNTTSSVSLTLWAGATEVRSCFLTNAVPSCILNNTIGNYALNGTATYAPSAPSLQGSTPLWIDVEFLTPDTPSIDTFSGGIWFVGPTYDPSMPNVMLSTSTQIAWQVGSNTSATLFFLQGPTLMLEQTLLTSFATEYSFSYMIGGTSVRGGVELVFSSSGYSPCGTQVISNIKLYMILSAYMCIQPETCSQLNCYAALGN